VDSFLKIDGRCLYRWGIGYMNGRNRIGSSLSISLTVSYRESRQSAANHRAPRKNGRDSLVQLFAAKRDNFIGREFGNHNVVVSISTEKQVETGLCAACFIVLLTGAPKRDQEAVELRRLSILGRPTN